jgi:hypothetical protein
VINWGIRAWDQVLFFGFVDGTSCIVGRLAVEPDDCSVFAAVFEGFACEEVDRNALYVNQCRIEIICGRQRCTAEVLDLRKILYRKDWIQSSSGKLRDVSATGGDRTRQGSHLRLQSAHAKP